MKDFTLTLPRMKLECPRCRHTWKQATPRWDRGHLFMKRGDRTVFVVDVLGYAFGESMQDVVVPLLRAIGYSDLTCPCPRCVGRQSRVVRGLLSLNYEARTLRVRIWTRMTSSRPGRNGSFGLKQLKCSPGHRQETKKGKPPSCRNSVMSPCPFPGIRTEKSTISDVPFLVPVSRRRSMFCMRSKKE